MTDNTQTEALLPSRETIMAQAQVFASAWAIAGSSFDSGDGMEVAEQEKAILADMTRRLHARIAELEAQLESIRAGGVSGPLMGRADSKEREALCKIGEEQAFEAWFKVDCPVEGASAKIAAKAAWKARASLAVSAVSGPLMEKPQEMPDLSALTERGAVAWAGVDAQAPREGRWYMVTHDGVATLCEDRRDAEKEAKDADMAWPHSGPHRAVQLVEASMAGFTAADMATASAQGFRDGVASVAANAPAPSAHIKEPYTLAEIKAKIASNDYSAEMLLQHAMLLLDSASLSANAGEPTPEVVNLRKALQFYAKGHHFVMHEPTAWDTVSGEPVNFYEDEAGTATVEDGSIAKIVLAGEPVNFDDEDEVAAPPTAQAEGWISVQDELPKCSKKPDSFGVEVLIWPPHEYGSRTAFYGRRHSREPSFYKYGALLGHIEFWRSIPAPPTSAEGVEHG